MAKIKARFNEWKHANHAVLQRVQAYSHLGYLFATLAELHSIHVVTVSLLLGTGIIHVIVIGEFE